MYFSHDKGNVYYTTKGEGFPILILHGYFVDHRIMSYCIEPFFKNSGKNYNQTCKRIYIDLPGMGFSREVELHNIDSLLEILLDFVDEIMPEQFMIMGQSYGCYLASAIAYKRKSRVKGLFYICPVTKAIGGDRSLPKEQVIYTEPIDFSPYDPKIIDNFKNNCAIPTEFTLARYLKEIQDAITGNDLPKLMAFKQNGYQFSFEAKMLNFSFDEPTTILMGKQDNIVGYSDALAYLHHFSRISFVVIDAAGHALQIEQPKILEAHLTHFLDQVFMNLQLEAPIA